jgi:ATP-dependent RNA helicase HelY
MFDRKSADLMSHAPSLSSVSPELLPQELTRVYTELAIARLRSRSLDEQTLPIEDMERLERIAGVYEIFVDEQDGHSQTKKAAAFVAGTTYQILGNLWKGAASQPKRPLETTHIHPYLASPLLFLIAGQNPDAREASKRLDHLFKSHPIEKLLIKSLQSLANEELGSIIEEAREVPSTLGLAEFELSEQGRLTLYGLCWAGLVQACCEMMNEPLPALPFKTEGTARDTFLKCVQLSVFKPRMDMITGEAYSTFGGPRHLARLLLHAYDAIGNTSIFSLPLPENGDLSFWMSWLTHRAKTRPMLWNSHKAIINDGFLDPGNSAVLVLPTGGGKTTLSELKIAAVLAKGQKVLFLVPTLALVDQLTDDLHKSFPAELGNMQISGDGDEEGLIGDRVLSSIEVMTPERCLAFLQYSNEAITEVGLIVFDECHLMTPLGGGTRSVDAMLCLLKLTEVLPEADILLLSAMIRNSQEVSEWIKSVTNRDCLTFCDSWKPSRQARGVVIYDQAEINELNIHYPTDRRYRRPRQKTPRPKQELTPFGIFGLTSNWSEDLADDTSLLKFKEQKVILARNKQHQLTPNANHVATQLAITSGSVVSKQWFLFRWLTMLFQQRGTLQANSSEVSLIVKVNRIYGNK